MSFLFSGETPMPDGTHDLMDWGWDGSFESEFLSGGHESRLPARVVVLTKLDLCPDPALITEVRERLSGVDIHAVCALDGRGLNGLKTYLARGRTIVVLGSSGVGKSTLVNALAGKEVMATSPIRAD